MPPQPYTLRVHRRKPCCRRCCDCCTMCCLKTLWGIGRFFVGICHCIGWFWYPCKERCNCCADRQKHGIGASKQPHERTSYSTF